LFHQPGRGIVLVVTDSSGDDRLPPIRYECPSLASALGARMIFLAILVALLTAVWGTSASAGSSAHSEEFVKVCGARLCLAGKPFVIHGATAYGLYGDPKAAIALARAADVNVLELSEFDTQYHVLGDVESAATWDRVDRFIAAVGRAGLHVILSLSEYGQSLAAAGQAATTTDWGSYLRFIADRRNTVTGVRYRHDPTIAMVLLYGEIPAPYSGDSAIDGTTREMTAYFQRSLAEWRHAAPNILVSTGGFSYIGESDSGIDWRTITADPNDATCDVEVNSTNDLTVSVPELSSYCAGLHKPWFLAAWSSCFGDPANGYDYFPTDAAMAAHARAMYALAKGAAPAAIPAVGSDFWNLGGGPAESGTCSIGSSFPLTLSAIRDAYRPRRQMHG
jgi:hypothetical protein